MSLKAIIDNLFSVVFKGIHFIPYDYSLFKKAITHKSKSKDNYEILECIGDGYLKGFIISAILNVYPDANEHFITESRITLEKTDTLAYLLDSEFPGLAELINVDNESRNINPQFKSIKEDVFEAICGALISYVNKQRNNLLYLIKDFYVNMFVMHIKHMRSNNQAINTNYVSILNSYCSVNKLEFPIYSLISKIDIGRGISFKMKIQLNNTTLIEEDETEKLVKQKCAQSMLNYLKGDKKYESDNDLNDITWYI